MGFLIIYLLGYVSAIFVMYLENKYKYLTNNTTTNWNTPLAVALLMSIFSWVIVIAFSIMYTITKIANMGVWLNLIDTFEGRT